MKKNFQNVLKGIFISSLTSLCASNNAEASNIYDVSKLKVKDDETAEQNKKQDLTQKFIIKVQSDNSYLIAGHTSHRSHSSHRSSSSTYSGSNSGSSSSGSSNYNYSTPSSSGSTTAPDNTSATKSVTIDTTSILGDRTLKLGMRGNDVLQLRKILIQKQFLVEDTEGENQLFDEKLRDAVVKFQKSVGLTADGIVGSKTVLYLNL
jgi:murein L,D-transpeptidase YcbB/YkuD